MESRRKADKKKATGKENSKAQQENSKAQQEISKAQQETFDFPPPKRAMNNYFIFALEMRPIIKGKNPELKFVEIQAEVSKKWRALTPAEKAPYQERSDQDRIRFKRQKAEYEDTGKFYDDDGNVVLPPKPKKSKTVAEPPPEPEQKKRKAKPEKKKK